MTSLSETDDDSTYRIYTTKFDIEVRADQIDSVLGSLGPNDAAALDEAWHIAQTGLTPWRTQLHLEAAAASKRIRSGLSEDVIADTVVTLLIDQSGSMRGQKMLFAAATADVVQEFLLTLGICCEVLGFTTSQWKGGRSRKRWQWRFRPRQPGRLNDLLHVIYKSADDCRASTGSWNYRQMLRADLPKENIDGEAIIWAENRLLALPESQKHLIVLSDGAPVDDSTLRENGGSYLSDHLQSVVNRIVETSKIKISAIGIGYRAHEVYPVSDFVEAPDELGTRLISLIEGELLR